MLFQLDETNLGEEIKGIIEKGEEVGNTRFLWRVTFKFPDGTSLTPFKITAIEILEDYADSLGDQVRLVVDLPIGDYKTLIYPNRSDLFVEVVQEPINFNTGIALEDEPIGSWLYKAIPLDQVDIELEGNVTSANKKDLDMQISSFEFDMINPTVDYLRQSVFGVTIEGTTNENALRTLYTYFGKRVPVDAEYVIKGVDVVKSNSDYMHRHLVIPDGTRVLDIHKWLQLHKGGVYSAGIASYIKGKYWYIFPPFNTQRYDDVKNKLLFINLPLLKYPQLELSYDVFENHTVVLLNTEVKSHDDTEKKELNEGVGVMYVNSEKIRSGFVTMDKNKGTVKRSDNIKRFGLHNRKEGYNYVPFSEDKISSNDSKQMSRLTRRNGIHMVVNFTNSDPKLMYPGQPVKMMYVDGDDFDTLQERQGVLLKAEHSITNQGGAFNNQMVCNSVLTLFIERKEKEIE